MVAATSGHKDIIDWFLARGHSFTGMNHEGKSASKIAQENGHHSVADMLKKMWEINQWHAKKTNAGYTDAAARERALRRQAEKIAAADIEKQHGSGVPDIHVVDAIFETLQQEDADKERIVRLREQQILGDKSKAKLARSRNEHQDL